MRSEAVPHLGTPLRQAPRSSREEPASVSERPGADREVRLAQPPECRVGFSAQLGPGWTTPEVGGPGGASRWPPHVHRPISRLPIKLR